MGFYDDRFTWSVRFHQGQWCLFARQSGDRLAETDEQRAAIEYWRVANVRKFHET